MRLRSCWLLADFCSSSSRRRDCATNSVAGHPATLFCHPERSEGSATSSFFLIQQQSFRASRVSLLLTFAPSLGLTLASRGRIRGSNRSRRFVGKSNQNHLRRTLADAMKPHPEAAHRSFDLRSSPKPGRLELAHPCAKTCEPCSRFRLRCSARFMAQEREAQQKPAAKVRVRRRDFSMVRHAPVKNGVHPARRPAGLAADTRRCAGAPSSERASCPLKPMFLQASDNTGIVVLRLTCEVYE